MLVEGDRLPSFEDRAVKSLHREAVELVPGRVMKDGVAVVGDACHVVEDELLGQRDRGAIFEDAYRDLEDAVRGLQKHPWSPPKKPWRVSFDDHPVIEARPRVREARRRFHESGCASRKTRWRFHESGVRVS